MLKRTCNDHRFTVVLLALSYITVLNACASVNQHTGLDEAKSNFAAAQQDGLIIMNAPDALAQAQSTLTMAQNMWEKEKNYEETDHLVYLAERQLDIVRARVDEIILKRELAQLEEEQNKKLASQRAKEQAEVALARLQLQRAKEKRELSDKLAKGNARVKETHRGLVLISDDLKFSFDNAELSDQAQKALKPIADVISQRPDRTVLIEGFTDNRGDELYNSQLSVRRAIAVRAFLIKTGINPDQLISDGHGSQSPVATNDNMSGRKRNRRVEIVILSE